MKKTILLIFILIPMMFCLCGCGNKEVVESNDDVNVDEELVEELEMDGTGEIKLKEFVESPQLLNKKLTDVTINDLKIRYNVNEEKQFNTIHDGTDELWINFSGKEVYVEKEENGVIKKTYTESVSVKDMVGSGLRISSNDLMFDEPLPEKIEISRINFEMQTESPEMDDELKKNILDKSEKFYPYIKENNCYSLEDILNALGMNETDKTVYKAIENNVEYYADYICEYGDVEFVLYSEEIGFTAEFEFKDENCEYDSISISEVEEKTEEGNYSSINITIRKNYN